MIAFTHKIHCILRKWLLLEPTTAKKWVERTYTFFWFTIFTQKNQSALEHNRATPCKIYGVMFYHYLWLLKIHRGGRGGIHMLCIFLKIHPLILPKMESPWTFEYALGMIQEWGDEEHKKIYPVCMMASSTARVERQKTIFHLAKPQEFDRSRGNPRKSNGGDMDILPCHGELKY